MTKKKANEKLREESILDLLQLYIASKTTSIQSIEDYSCNTYYAIQIADALATFYEEYLNVQKQESKQIELPFKK